MSSAYKNCPNCGSNEIVKIGFQSGRRRFLNARSAKRGFNLKKTAVS